MSENSGTRKTNSSNKRDRPNYNLFDSLLEAATAEFGSSRKNVETKKSKIVLSDSESTNTLRVVPSIIRPRRSFFQERPEDTQAVVVQDDDDDDDDVNAYKRITNRGDSLMINRFGYKRPNIESDNKVIDYDSSRKNVGTTKSNSDSDSDDNTLRVVASALKSRRSFFEERPEDTQAVVVQDDDDEVEILQNQPEIVDIEDVENIQDVEDVSKKSIDDIDAYKRISNSGGKLTIDRFGYKHPNIESDNQVIDIKDIDYGSSRVYKTIHSGNRLTVKKIRNEEPITHIEPQIIKELNFIRDINSFLSKQDIRKYQYPLQKKSSDDMYLESQNKNDAFIKLMLKFCEEFEKEELINTDSVWFDKQKTRKESRRYSIGKWLFKMQEDVLFNREQNILNKENYDRFMNLKTVKKFIKDNYEHNGDHSFLFLYTLAKKYENTTGLIKKNTVYDGISIGIWMTKIQHTLLIHPLKKIYTDYEIALFNKLTSRLSIIKKYVKKLNDMGFMYGLSREYTTYPNTVFSKYTVFMGYPIGLWALANRIYTF